MIQQLRRGLLVLIALALSGLLLWPRPALGAAAPGAVEADGARLFAQHCVGCHLNGGNVIRRGKTLRLDALRRAGLVGPEDVARVAALGQGQMAGYGEVLGSGGAEAVGDWVWQQALVAWPKSDQKITKVQP
jgi:cytochrome c6